MTTVARKKGTQMDPLTLRQSHMDSIHSPHSTRNTIIILCMKSVKFQRGTSFETNICFFSAVGKRRGGGGQANSMEWGNAVAGEGEWQGWKSLRISGGVQAQSIVAQPDLCRQE